MKGYYFDHAWPRSRKSRHVVRHYSSDSTYPDGSMIHHPATFPNKPTRDAFIAELQKQGYVYKEPRGVIISNAPRMSLDDCS